MLIHYLKRWCFPYIAFMILLTSLISGYFYGSKDPNYYVAANTLLLIAVLLIAIYIATSLMATKPIASSNISTHKLLANLSHEFRTPMIGIIGAVDLLESDNLTSEQSDNVEIIKKSGRNLLAIIDNVLEINKLELGQAETTLLPYSLKKIINSCAIEVTPSLKAKGLNFNIDIASDTCVIAMVDEVKLKQVVLNLLHQAIEYAEDGSIIIKANLKEALISKHHLLLSVTYTGSYKLLPLVNPLANLDNSSPANEFTSGLGLYFCKKLTEFMGGRFWISHQADGSSTFQLCLPIEILTEDQFDENETVSLNICSAAPFARIKVLLVEDNNFNVKILSQMLHNYGFEVTTANNGLECLQILQAETFNVILMDMQMPVMDGYEASRIISNDPNYSSIPIIAVTANAMIGDREKCLACGCTSYLAKPFQTRELTQEIEQVLKSRTISKKSPHPGEDNLAGSLPEFIAALAESISQLEEAYIKADWNLIINICHDIKGMAGIYSYKDIYHHASLIEAAGRKKMAKIVSMTLLDLKASYTDLISFHDITGIS